MASVKSKYVVVDGIRTHYLEAGEGDQTVVLLHSGEFGASAEVSWEFNIGALAEHFHVIAPDWLGFGRTDKIYDFAGGHRRLLIHMRRFIETIAIEQADFVGNSMGGTLLAQAAAMDNTLFPIRRIVLASGGGAVPYNEARKALVEYDCTIEGMKRILRAMLYDPKWAENEKYVARRHELSLLPGAWESVAAARFKSPAVPVRPPATQPDTISWENIKVHTLIMAGANDQLREPGYAHELAKRAPKCEVIIFENCRHCPNIEWPEKFNKAVIEYLRR